MTTNKGNNNWTEAKEHKLLEWQQQSQLHSLGHGRAQEVYSRKNNKLMLPSIVIGAIAVFLDGIALLWENNHKPFVICSLLLTAITTILGGILQATKPTEKASSHEDMCKGYNKIILQIDSILAKEYYERENGTAFLSMIEKQLIALKTGGVKIPAFIWNHAKDEFIAGECDFQQIRAEGHPLRPFQHTIKLRTSSAGAIRTPPPDADPPSDTVINIVSVPDDEIPDEGAEPEPEPEPEPKITPKTDSLPRFELRIDNDKKTRKMENMFFDFQMSRFG